MGNVGFMPSTVRTRVVLQIRVPFRARFIRVPYYIGGLTLISRTTHNGFGFRCSHGRLLWKITLSLAGARFSNLSFTGLGFRVFRGFRV